MSIAQLELESNWNHVIKMIHFI